MLIRIALAFCTSLAFFADAPAAEPIKIGVVSTLTGPYAEWGTFQVNGLKLALEDINKAGGILGRQVELRIEDNASSNPGTVLSFTKLFTDPEVKGIVGPIASTQIQAASPAIAKSGVPTMIGGTDPSLTHIDNKWVFRARPNDLFSSKVIADFGVNTLKLRKWAIVHATDAFGNGGARALTEELQKLGITPVLDQGYTSNSQDFAQVVLAVKKSGAEVLGTYMTVPADQGHLRQATTPTRREHSVDRLADDRGGDDPDPGGRSAVWRVRGRRFQCGCERRRARLYEAVLRTL